MRGRTVVGILVFLLAIPTSRQARAGADEMEPLLRLDFSKGEQGVRLVNGAKHVKGAFGGALEFTNALQYAELAFARRLDGIPSATIGGWFYVQRSGEQSFLFRGLPESGANGERMFPRQKSWVNLLLGTDQHGFFLGALNGNGGMPFPFVTLNEVPIDEWSQLVLVKTQDGFQEFYRNGVLVCSDRQSAHAPRAWPFTDSEAGEPLRLSVPLGGKVGEVWIYARAISADEVKADFESKKQRFAPALPTDPVRLRPMDRHPSESLWQNRGGLPTRETWPEHRKRIMLGLREVLGSDPTEKPSLDPKVISETDCGTYVRRKISIQVQPGDRMPAYLLVPKDIPKKSGAVVCFYGTTSGAGKETTVGLSGGKPGTPPDKNRDYAVWMAEAGFVAFAGDYLRDGERLPPSGRPYDTSDFYKRFPDWSIHGKDAWDTSRAIDYLQSLDFVDSDRIGMIGHSYGGHSTIFAAALDERIKCAWANGPVSDFLHHGMHWAVPKGGGNSQSLPAMRPFVLDRTTPPPITFYELTSLIAPRALVVGQAVGERRPMEEENAAAVTQVYDVLGAANRVRYLWYPGDHDFPPQAKAAAVTWFQKHLGRHE